MDRDAFDGLTKLLAAGPNRRSALGALLGAGIAGALGADAARKNRKKDRKKNRGSGKKGNAGAQVSAQAADCLSPGPSSNMNQCDFGGDPFGGGEDFSGQDLSGSSMVGTIFTNGVLVGTKLHSSNMRNANFRGANLTCADLSSSTLRNADFRGFAPLGRPTNLTLADLSSSGCAGLQTNQFTIICGTTWCDGSVRNDACPGGFDPDLACCGDADCAEGERCSGNQCEPLPCAELCAGCFYCIDLEPRGRICASQPDGTNCQACASSADCPSEFPLCAASKSSAPIYAPQDVCQLAPGPVCYAASSCAGGA